MREAAQAALTRLAPVLRDRRYSPDATVFYDMFSDGLVWSDESLDVREMRTIKDWQVLRFVFGFRTKLILGRSVETEPDPESQAIAAEMREIWDEARRLFPEWPGFDPRRCSPDLRGVYESLSAELWEEIERDQAEQVESRSSAVD